MVKFCKEMKDGEFGGFRGNGRGNGKRNGVVGREFKEGYW